jgi:hypothetical protein
VDSVILLKSGQRYTEVGRHSASWCFKPESTRAPDNFSDAIEWALNSRKADALIDVTVTTHRGNYFPLWFMSYFGSVVVYPETLCTTVSGTAIRFIE